MSAFEEAWGGANADNAGQQSDDLDPPPDGTYDVTLTDASAYVSKTKGEPWVKTSWQTGDGYGWSVLMGFKSQPQADITKAQVRELGINVEALASLEEVDAALREQVGRYYRVTVKTNGKFRNTFIDGPLAATNGATRADVPVDETDFQPVPAPGSDDDVPW